MDKIKAFKLRNPDSLIQTLGDRLRLQRLAKGMTQQELADRAGVSVSTLKLMEQQGKGSLQRMAKICVVLDLDGDLRELFAGQRSFESIEAVERTKRKRAPKQGAAKRARGALARRVAEHLADEIVPQRQRGAR